MSVFYGDIEAKALLLHYGISFTKNAQRQLEKSYLEKRRVYSNYDEFLYSKTTVPPEVCLQDSMMPATVIIRKDSPLHVDFCDGFFLLLNDFEHSYNKKIGFYKTPSFYGKRLINGERVEQYITKLFGHTIGVFASTHCYFAEKGIACKFCSIKSNSMRPQDATSCVSIDRVCEAIEVALACDDSINCVFISGGVISEDYNSNFLFYCSLAKEIKRRVNSINPAIEVTLNSLPPKSLDLVEGLRDTGIAYMLSMEAIDTDTRRFYCPGKNELFESLGVEKILDKFVDAVGYGRVLSFVIEGIENKRTILDGARFFGKKGVCIVSHILHIDPGTWVYSQGMCPPPVDEIMEIASEMSKIYHEFGLDTSILYGGRSSLDGESSKAVF